MHQSGGSMGKSQCNVALFSPGLGYINRGIETFTRELYEVLTQKGDLQVSLFCGTGEPIPGAISVWAPHRNAEFYDLPLLTGLKPRSYWIENVIFSIPLALHCYTKPCDIVHFNEGIPANVLYHLRNRLRGSFKLLFCNGGPLSPQQYMRYDYVQVQTPAQWDEGIAAGYPESNLFLVPPGIHLQPFAAPLTLEQWQEKRQQWQLPIDRSLILSVGAVNNSHKRMEWLIQEFSHLDPARFFLWIVGQPDSETPEIKDLATSLLKPSSYKFDVVPYPQMPDVYRIADYFVLCSLHEGVPRVYLEAMGAKLPVIIHPTAMTEWVLGADNLGLANMTQPGTLKEKLLYLEAHPEACKQQASSNQHSAIERFDWLSLYSQYLEMYQRILTE